MDVANTSWSNFAIAAKKFAKFAFPSSAILAATINVMNQVNKQFE